MANFDPQIVSSIILGITGLVITWILSARSIRLNKDKMFKELFTEFTLRYARLNQDLQDFADCFSESSTTEKLVSDERCKELKASVIDFFNLCAEEYYWAVVKKRIDEPVWRTWQIGMNYWVNEVPAIRELWQEETKMPSWREAYYIRPEDELFVLKEQ